MREFPQRGASGVARPTGSTDVSSTSIPSPGRGVQHIGRGRDMRGATSSSGAQNRTYALVDRQNEEASPDDGTGI